MNPEAKPGWISPDYTVSTSRTIDSAACRDNRCISLAPDSAEDEFFKVIRTQIMNRTMEKNRNTVMITSAVPGEGKTTMAINLALSFAKEFEKTVLLVDTDLKQQKIHQYLGIESKTGLTDYLLHGRPMDELIIWPGVEKFTVISGGSTLKDSSELLESMRMKTLVQEMKDRYPERYIVFDVPPLLDVADAIGFSNQVDAIVMVVEAGKTSIHDIHKALANIPREKFLGFVLNKHRS